MKAADDDALVSLLSLCKGLPVGKALDEDVPIFSLSLPVMQTKAADEDKLVLLLSSCGGAYELESNEEDAGNGHLNAANDGGCSGSNDNARGWWK